MFVQPVALKSYKTTPVKVVESSAKTSIFVNGAELFSAPVSIHVPPVRYAEATPGRQIFAARAITTRYLTKVFIMFLLWLRYKKSRITC